LPVELLFTRFSGYRLPFAIVATPPQLLDRYRIRGFAVVGLKFDTMAENPLQFAKKIRAQYPLAVATDDLKQSGYRRLADYDALRP
jgi:hypothetical protein